MRVRCPRCGHGEAGVRYGFDGAEIVACRGCRLLFLHPMPAPEETRAVYGDTYFENAEFLKGDATSLFGYVDYVAERSTKHAQYAHIAAEIRSFLPPGGATPRLLEIGCGFGYFLDEAFEEGFTVEGVEFNPHAARRLRRKFAFPIHSGAFEDMEFPAASFDAIAMFDVIEHLRDPFTCLDRVYDSLAPGGLLVVSTPDAESIVSRVIGKRLEDFRRTREHLFFFGRETLAGLLAERGFELLELRSFGHTFELGFLLDRLALYNRSVFTGLRSVAARLGLERMHINLNPRTKMIAFARRRGTAPGARAGEQASPRSEALEGTRGPETLGRRHYRWVSDVIAPFLGRKVLEVGSGSTSTFLIHHCESLVLSCARYDELRALRDRFGDIPSVRYARIDVDSPPFEPGVDVDTVVCLNVLERTEKDERALRAFAELLPSGGRLIVQVPNHPRLEGPLDARYGILRRYDRASLRARLEAAGFRVTWMRRFNPFAVPAWAWAGRGPGTPGLGERAIRLYDTAIPVLRALDFASRLAGLSLIACAEKLPEREALRRA